MYFCIASITGSLGNTKFLSSKGIHLLAKRKLSKVVKTSRTQIKITNEILFFIIKPRATDPIAEKNKTEGRTILRAASIALSLGSSTNDRNQIIAINSTID